MGYMGLDNRIDNISEFCFCMLYIQKNISLIVIITILSI